MDYIKLEKLPQIQASVKNEVSFRGGASSSDYNKFQDNILFDISNMFNLINEYNNTLQQTSELQAIESTYEQIRINKLKARVEELRLQLEGYIHPDTKYIKLYPCDMISEDETSSSDVNKLYDQVNIAKHTTISKLYLYDSTNELVTIPDTLKVDISPVEDGITIIDNDFNKALNGKKNECFMRKVIDNTLSEAEMTVEITLPDNIISNRDVNTIELSPFPYSSVDIMALEFQLNGNWIQIPGFTSHRNYKTTIVKDAFGNDISIGYIESAENIKLCFKKTPMSKVRIKLRQKTYINENNTRVFYIGLKSFNVNCEIINQDTGKFTSLFSVPNDGNIRILNGIVPQFNNQAVLSDQTYDKKTLISYEIYSVNDLGTREYIKNSFPIILDKSKYAIVSTIYYDKIADVNPSLYSLELLYNNTIK